MSLKLKLSMGLCQSFSAFFFISFGSVSNLTLETPSGKKRAAIYSPISIEQAKSSQLFLLLIPSLCV